MRDRQNIKIQKEIGRNEFFEQHSTGINFTGVMVNALLDGNKSHTCRRSLLDSPAIYNKARRYSTGSLMYVRESTLFNPQTKQIVYVADLNSVTDEIDKYKKNGFVAKYSYYVPRDMARLAIEITEVSHKQLHSLTHQERIAEGLLIREMYNQKYYFDYAGHSFKFRVNNMNEEQASFDSFRSLWIKLHGVDKWDDNPYVWSFYFEPILIV